MTPDSLYDLFRCAQPDLSRRENLHDHALLRAFESSFRPPCYPSEPSRTVFVGRLSQDTSEADLRLHFAACGSLVSLHLARHLVTGESQRYAFLEFAHRYEARRAFVGLKQELNRSWLRGKRVLVDWERGRTQQGWRPRRVGGGLGGFRNSGQIRFGGRDYRR
jgi:U11/U12 small nuclear ribonucleoprotein SNRNP35